MRISLLTLALSATPAIADLRLIPSDCAAVPDCIQAVTLSDLAMSPGRPIVSGDVLVLVGQGPGLTGTRDSLFAVDVSLDGPPAIVGVTRLDATASERRGRIEIAPDGIAYVLFTSDERDRQNRNRRVGAIQFFDQTGGRLGRVSDPDLPGWPPELEWSPVDLFETYAGTNALAVRSGAMSLRFGPFLMSAALADGTLRLAKAASGAGNDGLEQALDRLFDPVGGDFIWARPGLTGVFNFPADGRPSALSLAVTPATDPPDVLGHADSAALVLEPNLNDYSRDYASVSLSPDGTRLAVIRLTGDRCDDAAVAYEIRLYDTATAAFLWSQPGTRSGSAQLSLAFTRDNRLILTEARGAVDPPCGPTADAPAVSITLYHPP